jgi:GntR family transcriptional regulator/MocR family aminotransferase
VIEIAFRPARPSDVAVHRQLAAHLGALVETGRLPEGTKLPATRELARALGIARNTVTQAYEQLVVQGRFRAHVGQGTFVAPAAGGAGHAVPAARAFAWSGLLSRRVRGLRLHGVRPDDLTTDFPFDFRGGQVDAGSLPAKDLRWALAHASSPPVLRRIAAHRDPAGWPPLRREIARWLVARGIACEPDDVLVVTGAQQAIDLVARVLVDPGDTVAIEQPGYFGATLALGAAAADLVGIGVDGEGLRTDELARLLAVRATKLVYVTPATQCPTGVTLSETRRRELLVLADRHQTPILEDDYDCELRYTGPSLPALKSVDVAGQVIYAGTFSKILFPSIRVGYLVAPAPLRGRLLLARAAADMGTGVIEQAALATLLRTRGLERHLRRVRRIYAVRLAAMLAALARCMPAGTRWSEPRSGHLVWITLPRGADGARVAEAARARGIAYAPGEQFFADGRGDGCLSLSFTNLSTEQIVEGVEGLAAAVRATLGTPPVAKPARTRVRAAAVAGRGSR